LPEAAADWYEHVYMPVIERIRASGILAHFAGRTEADLYVWIAENRARLQMRYAIQREADAAVADFRQAHGISRLRRWLRRTLHRLFPRFVAREPGTAPSEPPLA
jgi:hypothetical protein